MYRKVVNRLSIYCIINGGIQCFIKMPNNKTDWTINCDEEDCDWNGVNDRIEGLIGLTNLGNTCYQNAILQVFTHHLFIN
jgi:uncharacterized UBP type Zn finger protein